MARVDEAPEERDTKPLLLPNMIDCPECDAPFDHIYTAPPGIHETEDLVDAPSEWVTCPNCGYSWERAWEGWLSHEDGG